MNVIDKRPDISMRMQWWLFKKQPINLVVIVIFLMAGGYGLFQGYAFKKKQTQTIEAFKLDRSAALEELKKGFTGDTTTLEGRAAYRKVTGIVTSNWYISLPAFKMPGTTSIFSIGQGDIFPYYHTVKNESFFMQLFKQGEIANPLRSLAGHFDTSFWVIFLLPLLIIVLCFNALAAELDNGNWKLISSQGISARYWVGSKLIFTGGCIELILLIIFVSGLSINYFYFDQLPTLHDLLFLVAANLYILFWLVVIFTINAIGKTASANALYSGIAWISCCIILPALVTTIVEKIIPVDNTSISRMSRRPQGSRFDDTTFGKQTIIKLGQIYPAYKQATIIPQNPTFRYAVYLSFHTVMDDTNTVKVQRYYAAIARRQQLINLSSVINPAAGTDGLFSHLAAVDAAANHDFVWQTKGFHDRLHDVYMPPVFFERKLTLSDYNMMPLFHYKSPRLSSSLLIQYLLLIVLIISIYFLGYTTFNNKTAK